MSKTLKTILVSEHSAGKSSFLNSLVGNIVAPISIVKETSRIEYYKLRSVVPPTVVPPTVVPPTVVPPTVVPPTVVPPTLVPPTLVPPTVVPPTVDQKPTYYFKRRRNFNNTMKNNLSLHSDWNKIFSIEPEIEICSNINMDVYDFPSRNNGINVEEYYETIFDVVKYPDLIVYMMDATKIYNEENIAQLISIMQNIIEKSFFVNIIIVFNKYDNLDDEDYSYSFNRCKERINEVFGNKIRMYRFNSGKYFWKNLNHNIKTGKVSDKEIMNSKILLKEVLKMGIRINNYSNVLNISTSENSYVNEKNGDWDNLLTYLEEKYQEIPENRTKYYDVVLDQIINLLSLPTTSKMRDFILTLDKCKIMKECYTVLLLKIVKYIIEKSTDDKILIYLKTDLESLDPNTKIALNGNNIDMAALLIPFIIKTNPYKISILEYILDVILNNNKLYNNLTKTAKILILRNLLEHLNLSEKSIIFNCLYELGPELNFLTLEINNVSLEINKIMNDFFNVLIERKNPDIYFILKITRVPQNILKIFLPKVEDRLLKLLGKKIVFYAKILLNNTEEHKTLGLDLLSGKMMKVLAAKNSHMDANILKEHIKFLMSA